MPACVQDDYLPFTDLPRPRRRVAARARRRPADRCREYISSAGYFGPDEFTYTIQDPDCLTAVSPDMPGLRVKVWLSIPKEQREIVDAVMEKQVAPINLSR